MRCTRTVLACASLGFQLIRTRSEELVDTAQGVPTNWPKPQTMLERPNVLAALPFATNSSLMPRISSTLCILSLICQARHEM